MTDAEILVPLKIDLQISVDDLDQNYLLSLIQAARDFITAEGITLGNSMGDAMLIEMYAAYLYRERRVDVGQYSTERKMPRMLRWALNNRLFEEKAAT